MVDYREMREQVKAAMDQLSQKRREIDLRREEIDREFAKLEKVFDALADDSHFANLAEITVEMGLTDAVRSIVRHASGTVSPTGVRDRLLQSGFENSKILLPMVHNALRRLSQGGEITKVKVDGRTCYQKSKTRR